MNTVLLSQPLEPTLEPIRAESAAPTAPRTAAYVPAGDGPFVALGDHRGWVKMNADQTGGDFLLFEVQADYQGGVPPHIHHREDETFYILEGHIQFQVGDKTMEVGPGDTVFGPRSVPHAWRTLSPEGSRLLILFTPGANFQAFGMGMAQQGADPQADMADPAKAAAFVALAARHGIEMLPPR